MTLFKTKLPFTEELHVHSNKYIMTCMFKLIDLQDPQKLT